MKKHFWQQILVPLVLVFAILICGTSNVLGKYAGGDANTFHPLAFTIFDAYNIEGAITVGGDEEGDIPAEGGVSDKNIWGYGNENDEDNRDDYRWDDATGVIFTVKNDTDTPMKIEVVITVALPYTRAYRWNGWIPEGFDRINWMNIPYTLRELCQQTGSPADATGYLTTYGEGHEDRAPEAIEFNVTGEDDISDLEDAYDVYGSLGLVKWASFKLCTVDIPTQLVLQPGHVHTYQIDFGIPYGEKLEFFIDWQELFRNYSAYYSIQARATPISE